MQIAYFSLRLLNPSMVTFLTRSTVGHRGMKSMHFYCFANSKHHGSYKIPVHYGSYPKHIFYCLILLQFSFSLIYYYKQKTCCVFGWKVVIYSLFTNLHINKSRTAIFFCVFVSRKSKQNLNIMVNNPLGIPFFYSEIILYAIWSYK